MGIKNRIAKILLPVARLYIRYFPFRIGKSFLFKQFYWRDFDYTAHTKFGALMSGKAADLVQGFIYYFGVWEPNLTEFVNTRLCGYSDRTFIDVGANVGYFSLLAARHLKNGRVVAIEAFPSIFSKLELNVKLNKFGNIRLVPWAVTDIERDIIMFHAGADNEGATTSVAGIFNSEPIKIAGKPLANLLTDSEIKSIKLIKIDVEGAEYSVVSGMKELIKSLPDDAEVVVEICPSAYSDGQLEELFDIFASAQFLPYKLENSYAYRSYIEASKPVFPSRLQRLPAKSMDVVFSKISAEFLN